MVDPTARDLERPGARPNVEEDERLDEVEEVDRYLADQQSMQCSNWEGAQDADSVIKRMKMLMEEYGDVAPTNEQLLSELAEVKSLCQHWRLLEIINGVVTRVMRDLTYKVV